MPRKEHREEARGGEVGVSVSKEMGNTRLYTAAAALCNRAVTMTTFKGLG